MTIKRKTIDVAKAIEDKFASTILSMQLDIASLKEASTAEPDPAAVEDMLIGDWLAQQHAAGNKSIDLDKVEILREGIRLVLA